jgi:hypothetical protein
MSEKILLGALKEICEYVEDLGKRDVDTSSANHCGSIADDALLRYRVAPVGMEYPEGINPECCKQRKPLTYLACPYSHPSPGMRDLRYEEATRATAWLIKQRKWNVFSPITHSHPIASLGLLPNSWKFWREIDREYLECCCRLVVLQISGWDTSTGVTEEIKIAAQLGLDIVYLTPAPGTYTFSVTSSCAEYKVGCDCKTPPPETPVRVQPPTSKATTTNPKDLVGSTKVSLSKFPAVALAHGAHAMMDGAKKYHAYNFRAIPVQASIYVDAAMRHILDWFEGEEDAPDSKAHHLGHAMACCAILLDCQENETLIDDRPVTGTSRGVMSRVLDKLREKITKA